MANIMRRGEGNYWDLRREVDRLFEDFFTPGEMTTAGRPQAFTPRLEVYERDDHYVLRAELAGMRPEDVELNVDNGVLTLRGEKRGEENRAGRGFAYSECSYGAFSRSIQLPQGTDATKIQASYNQGVLEVQIPKAEAARPRRIAIGGQAAPQLGAQQGAPAGAQAGASQSTQGTNVPVGGERGSQVRH